MREISGFLRGLIIPPGVLEMPPSPGPLALQRGVIERVWSGAGESRSFGLERLVRLCLAAAVFLCPSIYLRQLYGSRGLIGRKIGSDILVAVKLAAPLLLLWLRAGGLPWAIVVGWLLIETVVYVAGNLMLADAYGEAFSGRRTFLLLLLNYWEITFCFAYLYYYLGVDFGSPRGGAPLSTPIGAVYFSTVVSTTLGFGDIAPETDASRVMLMLHVWTVAIVIMTVVSSVLGDVRRRP